MPSNFDKVVGKVNHFQELINKCCNTFYIGEVIQCGISITPDIQNGLTGKDNFLHFSRLSSLNLERLSMLDAVEITIKLKEMMILEICSNCCVLIAVIGIVAVIFFILGMNSI